MKVIFTRGVVRDRSSTFSSFKRAILFARLIKIFDAEILELEKKKFDVKILSLSFFRPRASSSRKILRKRLPLSSPLLRYFALMQFLEWPQARSPLNFHQHSQSGPPRRENRCRGSQWLGSLVREGSSFLPSFFLLLFSPFYSMYTPHLSSIVPNSSSARSVSLSPGTIAGRGGVEALTAAWISRLTNKRERRGERTRLIDRSRSIRFALDNVDRRDTLDSFSFEGLLLVAVLIYGRVGSVVIR